MTLLHPRRFAAPPESIADLLRSDHQWHLVRGEVLALLPPGSPSLSLPHGLVADSGDRPAVLARVDLEETADAWPRTRPLLTTIERGRSFYVADGHGRALVRVADDFGRLHPDVELHLGAPFVEHQLRPAPDPLVAYVRTLSAGDPLYILGRHRLVTHGEAAGLRDVPLIPAFSGELGPLHLYDEAAFRQLAAWYALPWYRKLSLLVRNR